MAKTIKLKCGATIITEKNATVRSASLGIWVKSGSVYESRRNNGVSHYLEHMMFKGTKKRSARQIAEEIDAIGASSNAFTGKEATCYYIKTLSSNIYKGAEILLDMILHSTFNSEEMDKERHVILEELKMVTDTPDDDVFEIISGLVNANNPMGRSILGTTESLYGIDRDILTHYYEKRYAREGIVIAVVGDFDEDKIIDIFESQLTKLRETLPEEKYAIGPYHPQVCAKVKDIEQTHICLGVPGVGFGDDMYHTFVLMNSIFGGSMSSRLFQHIREEKGLAYSVYSMNSFGSKNGFFNIYAGIAHDKLQETIKAIEEELEKLATEGVTENEVSMAKEQVKSSHIFSLENTTSFMFSLGRNMLLLNKTFSVDESIKKYNKVTAYDIKKAAAIIADIKHYSAAAVTGKEIDLAELIY